MEAIDRMISERSGVVYNELPDFDKIDSCIVFIYNDFSPVTVQLVSLLKSLESFPNINLFIIDLGHDSWQKFKHQYDLFSHGYGETYWMKKGRVISDMNNYIFDKDANELINHNGAILKD